MATLDETPAPLSERRREALKERILRVLPRNESAVANLAARPAPALLDTTLALDVGVANRDVLRGLVAELAIDGKVRIVECNIVADIDRWGDGAEPWLIRLAPAGTPSLEDRVVAALAEAGVRGIHAESLVENISIELDGQCGDVPFDVLMPAFTSFGQRVMASLIERGVASDFGGQRYALSHAEWARRIVERFERSVGIPHWTVPEHRAAVERLLAGTTSGPAQPASDEPASSTLPTGHAPREA